MVDGIPSSPLSKSNVINLDSKGSIELSRANNAFHCGGNVFNTSRVDIAIGDWSKSSTIL